MKAKNKLNMKEPEKFVLSFWVYKNSFVFLQFIFLPYVVLKKKVKQMHSVQTIVIRLRKGCRKLKYMFYIFRTNWTLVRTKFDHESIYIVTKMELLIFNIIGQHI